MADKDFATKFYAGAAEHAGLPLTDLLMATEKSVSMAEWGAVARLESALSLEKGVLGKNLPPRERRSKRDAKLEENERKWKRIAAAAEKSLDKLCQALNPADPSPLLRALRPSKQVNSSCLRAIQAAENVVQEGQCGFTNLTSCATHHWVSERPFIFESGRVLAASHK